MLAIVNSMKEWHYDLEGTKEKITIFTDHENLQHFMTTKVLSRQQVRWAEELLYFDFIIIYHPGTKNGKADALSRRPDYEENAPKLTPWSLLKPEQMIL